MLPAGTKVYHLQWGRRVNAAEVRHMLPAGTKVYHLQWGRRVNAAEVRPRLIEGRGGQPASMGPPRERGGSNEEGGIAGPGVGFRFNGAAA